MAWWFRCFGRNALCVVNFVSGMAPDQNPVLNGTEVPVRPDRPEQAISEFERLVREHPHDVAAAETLADRLVAAADAAATAGRCAEALAYLSVVANWCESRGNGTGAADLRAWIERLELSYLEAQLEFAQHPNEEVPAGNLSSSSARQVRSASPPDIRLQALQARTHVARGDAVGAAKHLTAEMAEGDPALLVTIAEIQLRGGRLDSGIALMERAIAHDLSHGDDVVRVGLELAEHQPDAGFLLVEMVADAWAAQSEWPKATAAFEEFITQEPDYVPALVRLRELEAAATDASGDTRVVPFRPLPSAAPKSRSA